MTSPKTPDGLTNFLSSPSRARDIALTLFSVWMMDVIAHQGYVFGHWLASR